MDATFNFINLPTGRSIEFTLDIFVDPDNTSAISITFPQVTNPPVLPGLPGDRNILRFIGVNRTDPLGITPPVQTFTFLTGATTVLAGYSTIQEEGTPVTQRNTMNFIGAGVTAVDNPAEGRTDITITAGAGSQTPWLSDIDAAGFSLNNLLSLDIEDSVGDTKLNISGPLGVGARFSFVNGDSVLFTEDITDRLKINADGLDVFAGDIINIDRLQMSGGTTSVTSVNDVVWYLDSNGNLVSNVNGSDGWIWSTGNVAKMILTDSTLQKRNITAPVFELYNTIAAQVGTAGNMNFLANSENTTTGVIMSSIIGDTEAFAGDGRGSLKLNVNLDGTLTPFLTMNDGDDEQVDILKTLDMNSNFITNASFVESNTADRPGSGFLRMAFTDQVIWRDVLNTDNLFIDVQRPDLGEGPVTQDAFAFTVASGVQMYIGEFDISVQDNDIINTGDVLPGTGTHEVGDSVNFYNQMHSQFFIPENATVITSRFGFAKTNDLLYINFEFEADVTGHGFAIFQEGLEQYSFKNLNITANDPPKHQFQIGSSDTFISDESYTIQMGNNSNSSAEIKFVEGEDNLIINRKGVTSTKGVELQTGNNAILRTTSTTVQFLKNADLDSNDIINVVNIKSNGDGSATTGTIGELITADGGFDYFMRETLAWDQDVNVKLTFSSGGITLETNGSNDNIDIKTPGTSSDITIRAASDGFLSMGLSGINHLQFGSGVTTFSTANINLISGAQEIQFLDAIAGTSATTPSADDINLFNDLTTGELSVKKPNGDVISLEAGGIGEVNTASNLGTTTFGLFAQKSGVDLEFKSLIAGTNVTLTQTTTEVTINATGGGDAQTPWLSDINADNNSLQNIRNLEFQEGAQPDATVVSFISRQTTNLIYNSPGTDGHILTINGAQKFGVGPTINNSFNSLDMNANKITDMLDPTANQDAATKFYVDSTFDLTGIQDATQSIEQEGGAFNFEIWMSNSKQGDKDVQQSTSLFFTPFLQQTVIFLPIYLGERFRIESVGVDIGTLNVNDMSMAIYDSEPSLNYPKTRITDSVNSTINTTGIFRTLFNEDVEAGLYWIAIWFDNGAISTIRHWPGVSANSVGWVPVAGTSGTMNPLLGFSDFQTSNLLPGLADNDMAFLSGAVVPAVFAKLVFNPN